MSPSRPGESRTLVVVAHPDDESLWFSSVIRRQRADVLCVSCGHAGDHGRRRAELQQACALLGAADVQILDHSDDPTRSLTRRLDVDRLLRQLEPFAARGYAEVFTHSPLGEPHEHPHHQDVSHAVHQVFGNVWSNAWNQRPSRRHELSAEEYALKQQLLGSIYWQEYVNLKATYEIAAVESFCRHDRAAVAAFHAAIARRTRDPRAGVLPYPDPLRTDAGGRAADTHRIVAELLGPLAPRSLLGIGVTSAALQAVCRERLPGTALVTADGDAGSEAFDAVLAGAAADDPEQAAAARALLARMTSPVLLLVTPADPRLTPAFDALAPRYRLLRRHLLPPRWESVGPASPGTDPLTVYQAGVLLSLFERKPAAAD